MNYLTWIQYVIFSKYFSMTQTVMDITIKLGVLNVPLDPHDNGLDDGNLTSTKVNISQA